MIKDIKYGGYTAQPSDYQCQDGELAVSLNLINEEGALCGISQPAIDKTISQAQVEALFIHKTTEFTHYIVKADGYKIGWIDADGSTTEITEFKEYYYGESISHVNALGNTLLVFTKTGINYYLWKDGDYKYLGDHVPDIGISFGLVGHPRLFSMADESKSKFKISFAEGIPDGMVNAPFSDKNKTSITSQVMAKVNKFIANETVKKGRFCFPFFVRYALRLFDGSLVGHSVPILMNPSTTACPVVLWDRLVGKKSTYTEAELDIMLVAATLDYRLTYGAGDDWVKLPDWTDIIKSVDVFISKPLYSFDQNGECSSFSDSDDFESRFIGRLFHKKVNTTTGFLQSTSAPREDSILGPVNDGKFVEYYAEWPYSYIHGFYFNQARQYPGTTLHMPEFSDDKNLENLRNASIFYKLCSIDTTTLYNNRNTRTDIKIEDEYLQSLVSREVMTDDYLSHDRLRAESSYCYNNRLNLGGVKRKLFSGFMPAAAFAFVSPVSLAISFNASDNNKINITSSGDLADTSLTVFIKENGKEYRVSAGGWEMYGVNIRDLIDVSTWTIKTYISGIAIKTYEGRYKYHWPSYFFYPNVNAYRIAIHNNGETYYIDLKPHEFLNGAFAVLDYNTIRKDNSSEFTIPPLTTSPASDDYNVVSIPNKVYTSEVNNPFFFPLLGINTVGTGNIMRLCTAAKALSQGQFGQFPLYAFTDEGVWAMEISATGTYTARQPITRDVCINPDGITQIDSAVLFPTDRGIMLISGSQTQCITDSINSETPFDVLNLPGMEKLHTMLGHIDTDTHPDRCLPVMPFSEFLKDCGMIYDYVHQRIIVYNNRYTYAYVYSLKTQLWGMMYSDIKNALNSYPEALAVDKSGNIVNFSKSSGSNIGGLLVTRPLKLDAADVLKTVDTIIQRGNFRRGHVQSVIYGSRDLYNWSLIWSSKDHYLRGFRGTPYKYFRIALLCNLTEDESIYGATVQYDTRKTNQPR